jgi:hypothetical protein
MEEKKTKHLNQEIKKAMDKMAKVMKVAFEDKK